MEKIIFLTLVAVFILQRCNGKNSKGLGTCSYWYDSSPLSLKCIHGERVRFVCTVYAPKVPQVDVRWHITLNEGDELNDKTRITTADYSIQTQFPYQYSLTNQSLFTGLFYGVSTLIVTAFSENHTGYYWCQMVISEHLKIALDPSEPASLITGDVGTGCMKMGMTNNQRKCVDPKSGRVVKRAEPTTTCEFGNTLREISNPGCIPSPTPNSTAGDQCTGGGTSCFVYVGVAIGIVAMCLGIFITATVCIVSRRRRNEVQQSTEREDDHCSYVEMPREAHSHKMLQRSEESYQSLSLGATDYTHMYSHTTPPVGRKTTATDVRAAGQEYCDEHVYAVPGQYTFNEATVPTTERGRQLYTAMNPINFESSNQYTQLHSQHETVI